MGKIKSSDGKTSLNVKEMLQKGMKPEELIKQLQDEIDAAQEEIKVENKPTPTYNLTELRHTLAVALTNYLIALDVMYDDCGEDGINTMLDLLIAIEKDLKNFRKLEEVMDETEDDKLLKMFLRAL